MNVFDLVATITLSTNGYETSLSAALKKTQSFSTQVKNGFQTLMRVCGAALTAVSESVIKLGTASVQTGMEFDSSMAQVAATLGKTIDQVQDLREFAQEMGRTTVFSATQAADALNYMALAGYDAETSMKMLPSVLDLAAAGSFDLALASDMITDSQSALGLSLKETDTLVDQMAKTASKSNTSVKQLGDAILDAGGAAKQMAKTQLDNLAGDVTLFKSALEGAEIAISDGLSPTLREFVQYGSGALSTLTTAYKEEGLPGLLAALDGAVADGLTILTNTVPRVLEVGGAILNALAGGIIQNLPAIAAVAVELVVTLANGISQNISALSPSVLSAISIIVNKLTEPAAVAAMIGAALQIMIALSTGLIDAIPRLMGAIPEIIHSVLLGFEAAQPQLEEAGEQLLNAAKEGALAIIKGAPQWGKTMVENIKLGITLKWGGLYSDISSKFESVHTKISDVFNRARNTVSNAINGIRNLFNFEWHLPHISLPTFTWDWQDVGGILKLPSIHVSWNRKAYDTPYLFSEPTVLQGFGDGPGDEMVYGRASLMEDIREASGADGMTSALETMIGQLQTIIERMQFSVVLDDGTLVGRLAPRTDDTLNELNAWRGRGLSIA